MEKFMREEKRTNENMIEGRNAVLEAFRSGKTVDKLYVQDGCKDGPVQTILREARKQDTIVQFVGKERLSQLSETGKHQGVIASVASYAYSTVEEMLALAKERGEDPFLILLDNIEDPHNLGAIIRTANLAGAHGVIIPKRRAAGLTAVVDGERMNDLNLKGPIGLVIGSEGEGVGRLVKETCDFVASIPMKGQISSLNASVAAGVLAYEIVRQRLG